MTLNNNINKNTRKSKLYIKTISNSKTKSNITYKNNLSIQQNINTIPTTNIKKLIPSKKSKIRIHKKSLSMSNIQLIENNSYTNSALSHEKSPSELRTPKTILEDSFIKKNKENTKVKIAKTKKIQKKKFIKNSHNMKSSKNINSKLRLNKQNLFGFIPSMQQSVLVKKNKILNSNNKNRSNYEEKIEPIHQQKKIYIKKFKKNNEKDNIKDIIKIEIYIKMKLKKWKNIFQIK